MEHNNETTQKLQSSEIIVNKGLIIKIIILIIYDATYDDK